MISRSIKKRQILQVQRDKNNRKKIKPKSKIKQKYKRINAQDFLQAFIDLQNTNCSTNKKKRNTTRDITSALTIGTPGLEKNFSNSKIRSRSSFSQYRKKFTTTANKQPLKIHLSDIITQQDNVQYTQKTSRENREQEQLKKQLKDRINNENALQKKKINLDLYAIKIQRAWRNYQTYKMIYQVYIKQKKNIQDNCIKYFIPQQHIKYKKYDLEKTLKIKKNDGIKKQNRKQQQLIQTKKIIKQRFRIDSNNSQHFQRKSTPIQQFDQLSQDAIGNAGEEDSMIQKIKQMQAQRFNEVITLIQKQSKVKSKQQLLNQLIIKFEQNKSRLETEMNKHLQQIQHHQINNKKQSKLLSNYIQKQKQNYHCMDIKGYDSQRSLCYDYQNLKEQYQELKIYEKRLKMIKEQKDKKIEEINIDILKNRIYNKQIMQKKQYIYIKYNREIKQIQQNKKQFILSLKSLKKNAIQFQKFQRKSNSSLTKIRKSFSVGNTVLKSVLQSIKISQIEQDFQQVSNNDFDAIKNSPFDIKTQSLPLPNTPIINLSSPKSSKSSDKDNLQQKLLDKINTQAMKQYSQNVQQLIEKQLIQQFVRYIFLEQRLYLYFRPYIQQVYQFTKLTDGEICNFLKTIKQYFPEQKIIVKRINQKINPTSLQILKIIRDLDYEIDQYQLIIPQDSFKRYRCNIQKNLQEMHNRIKIDKNEIYEKINDRILTQKIYRIQIQKKQKIKKYRNFEKDLKVMYMKSVFNCINEFIIQCKSINAFMNGRSSIGPGQLKLAIKQYNEIYNENNCKQLLDQVQKKLIHIINQKCLIPSLINHQGIQKFQNQIMKQIKNQNNDNQFKWINYMDQVLQIWQDLCLGIIEFIIEETSLDILSIFK